MLVLVGKDSSQASSRFLPMGFAEVRVRVLVVSIKKACRCSSERLVVSINSEGLLSIWIDGCCHGSSQGSRGFCQWVCHGSIEGSRGFDGCIV